MRVEQGFQLTPLQEPNPYLSDQVLPSLLRRLVPLSDLRSIDADLSRFGDRINNEIRQIGAQVAPPTLTQYNHWGQRIDRLDTSEGWRKIKSISQEEGLVAIPYERRYGEYSRLYGLAKAMLLTGDGQMIYCPLSMTDGCARVLELMGTPEMKRDIYPRLISREPSVAMTSGQWMTERTGGSDVSRTETTATFSSGLSNLPGAKYKLNGFKWFSSATDSDVAVALARTGPVENGSRSLSLFLVPLRLPLIASPGVPQHLSTNNGILIHRLKNKLGTHQLPTAELSLNSSEAFLLGTLNQGVKAIAPVLNITRIHSAISSAGALRRCLSIARSYSKMRAIQGGRVLLQATPLHTAELAKISLLYRALTHLIFGAVHLLGKTECGVATKDDERRLRLMTPAVKAFAADKACAAMEECMAALGGQGYMEETGIGQIIRDSLVEKIWEGTITVLSLDLVRAAKDRATIQAYAKESWADSIIKSCPPALERNLTHALQATRSALDDIVRVYSSSLAMATLLPRPALVLFSQVTASLYLLEHAVWSHNVSEPEHETDAEVFVRWVEEGGLKAAVEDVHRMSNAGVDRVAKDKAIIYGTVGAKL